VSYPKCAHEERLSNTYSLGNACEALLVSPPDEQNRSVRDQSRIGPTQPALVPPKEALGEDVSSNVSVPSHSRSSCAGTRRTHPDSRWAGGRCPRLGTTPCFQVTQRNQNGTLRCLLRYSGCSFRSSDVVAVPRRRALGQCALKTRPRRSAMSLDRVDSCFGVVRDWMWPANRPWDCRPLALAAASHSWHLPLYPRPCRGECALVDIANA
jgi:hypothetical protein